MEQTPATPDASGVALAYARLAAIRLEDSSTGDVLQQVADLARSGIPGAGHVSVTLVEGDHLRTAASTGELATQLDQHQYDLGSGPCVDAVLSAQTVTLPDLDAEERYGDFVALAREAGVRAIASVVLPAQPRVVAGLNVYALGGRDGDGSLVRASQEFADRAAATVANAALLEAATQTAEQWRQAVAARAVIEQAKGLLVARLGCTPERAFELLTVQSQQTNRKVRDIAAQLVSEAQRAQPERGA